MRTTPDLESGSLRKRCFEQRALLHAPATKSAEAGGRDRWYDKHQIVAFADGTLGVNFEHSFSDGMSWNHWIAQAWKHLDGSSPIPSPPAAHADGAAPPLFEPLEWELDTSAIAAASGFSLSPTSGVLAAEGDGKGAVVTVTFAPTSAGRYVEAVPVYVNERGASLALIDADGDGKVTRAERRAHARDAGTQPYLQLALHGTAVHPRLTFDRAEVVLPPVALGHLAKASFYVVNEGYDNLQVEAKVPVDKERAPLTVEFPEGNLVGISKQKLLVVVAFVAKRPMSFTANVEFVDSEGTRFAIPVSATADNSLVTLQPTLTKRAPLGDLRLIADDAMKPVTLIDLSADARRGSVVARL